jgi:hypothetical protein
VPIIDNIQFIDFFVTWLKLIAFLQPTSHDATMHPGDTHCVLHAPEKPMLGSRPDFLASGCQIFGRVILHRCDVSMVTYLARRAPRVLLIR